MNNLSSYFGLIDAKIRASDINLPVRLSTHYLSAKSPLEDGNSDQKISHQHIRQKGSLGHHS